MYSERKSGRYAGYARGKLVNFACQRTKDLLMEHKDELEALTMLLMEKEVVDNVDLECIMGKRSKKNDAPADEL